MNEQAVENSIEACFGRLYDPRLQGRCDHKLIDIIIIAVCGMITGAESWVEVETFGKEREAIPASRMQICIKLLDKGSFIIHRVVVAAG